MERCLKRSVPRIKQDFQKQTDRIVASLGALKPTLLLHCCCGPCATYVLEYLTEYFDITALFYNPNIYPMREYEKRLQELVTVLEKYGGRLRQVPCNYEPEHFELIARDLGNEAEGGVRCIECFRLRLGETARRAAEEGFEYFCTSLTVSPHKDSEAINRLGFEYERQYGVKWLVSDFKKRDGYKRSIELTREYGLYRQDYCGCVFSKEIKEKKDTICTTQTKEPISW